MEKEIESLKTAATTVKGESSKWEKKCKVQASALRKEKQILEEKVAQLVEKKNALEQYIEDFCKEMYEKLSGKSFLGRMEFLMLFGFLQSLICELLPLNRALL